MTTHQNLTANDILHKNLENGKIFTAYRFVGVKNSGQQELAEDFAHRTQAQSFTYEPSVGNKELFSEFLKNSGFKSNQRRIFIINEAETLSPSNFSLLLKVIEEASNTNTFILVDNSDSLPATLVSRCFTLRFTKSYSSANTHKLGPFLDNTHNRFQLLSFAKQQGENEKEELIAFFDNLLIHSRAQFAGNAKVWTKRLLLTIQSQKYLKENVNKKAILDNLAAKW